MSLPPKAPLIRPFLHGTTLLVCSLEVRLCPIQRAAEGEKSPKDCVNSPLLGGVAFAKPVPLPPPDGLFQPVPSFSGLGQRFNRPCDEQTPFCCFTMPPWPFTARGPDLVLRHVVQAKRISRSRCETSARASLAQLMPIESMSWSTE